MRFANTSRVGAERLCMLVLLGPSAPTLFESTWGVRASRLMLVWTPQGVYRRNDEGTIFYRFECLLRLTPWSYLLQVAVLFGKTVGPAPVPAHARDKALRFRFDDTKVRSFHGG
jgi:hypothetical protein